MLYYPRVFFFFFFKKKTRRTQTDGIFMTLISSSILLFLKWKDYDDDDDDDYDVLLRYTQLRASGPAMPNKYRKCVIVLLAPQAPYRASRAE